MVIAFLALTAVVLLALEVPLAVVWARRERDARATTAQRDASALAALSEEAIEHPESHDLAGLLARYTQHNDLGAVIFGPDARPLAVSHLGDEVESSYRREVAAALGGRPASGRHDDDGGSRQFVATPVGSGTTIRGAVLITYPSGPVERSVHRIWAGLALLAFFVLGLAGLLGVAVARSVTKPLRRLERTAGSLRDGNLQARITTVGGPAEVRALADTFNDMAGRLSELVDSQRGFVADASHQLRSPLTALRLRLEGMDTDDPALATDLEAALREVHRLSRLVDGLLALARVEGTRIDRRPVDVVAVTHERRTAWEPLAEERGIALAVQAPPEAPPVNAIPGSLDQILDNLVANALDASPPGGHVTIAVEEAPSSVLVRVADDGPGMAADERQHAFDRFWHGRSKRGHSGTGLGLAIVRQLTVASGGTVELHDHDGGGLDVHLRFPIVTDRGQDRHERSEGRV